MQAILACAGAFTLTATLADPVELWRLTVLSRQGEPLRAVATLERLPEEHITSECLSLGSEADAPGGDAPLLKQADLQLNAAGNAVQISTQAPMSSPALELVLRVQCPGAHMYARHFAALIPPATAAITGTGIHSGYRLKVAPGESLASLVAAVAPGNRKLQRQLAQEVIAANPEIFPAGKAGAIPAGTVLWFPDLRTVAAKPPEPVVAKREPVTPKPAKPAPAVKSPAPVVASPEPAAPAAQPEPVPAPPPKPRKPRPATPPPATAGEPVQLRQALALGEKPGADECRALLPLCGALDAAGPAFDQRAGGLDSGVQSLKLRQDSIDSQLARLEQSLQDLRKVIESQPVAVAPVPAAPPPPPPKPEIRTVVKTEYRTEPLPWFFWLGVAVAALIAAAAGFFFGRKRGFSESLADSDERLDAMLASAADEMRDLDRAPTLPRNIVVPPPTVRDTAVTDVNGNGNGKKPAAPAAVPDITMDTLVLDSQPRLEAPPEVTSPPDARSESVPGVNSDLAFEMDQALDNTRSMFTDVDRFIALGRTQNALSLLQFQVVKDPQDRDSWIKLLAIYRQEKMEADLEKALRDFRRHFPNDKAAQP